MSHYNSCFLQNCFYYIIFKLLQILNCLNILKCIEVREVRRQIQKSNRIIQKHVNATYHGKGVSLWAIGFSGAGVCWSPLQASMVHGSPPQQSASDRPQQQLARDLFSPLSRTLSVRHAFSVRNLCVSQTVNVYLAALYYIMYVYDLP